MCASLSDLHCEKIAAGRCLDLQERRQGEAGENCIKRNVVICAACRYYSGDEIGGLSYVKDGSPTFHSPSKSP